MDVASGTDRNLDINFGLQVVESSSPVSILFREAFNYPYSVNLPIIATPKVVILSPTQNCSKLVGVVDH